MSRQRLPAGWDKDRVRDVIDHYDSLTEEEQAAEDDEAAGEHSGLTVNSIPEDLAPVIRQLLAARGRA